MTEPTQPIKRKKLDMGDSAMIIAIISLLISVTFLLVGIFDPPTYAPPRTIVCPAQTVSVTETADGVVQCGIRT